MNAFKKIGSVISRPVEFFQELISEGLGPAFGYFALILVIMILLLIPVVLVGSLWIETPAWLLEYSQGELAVLIILGLVMIYLLKLVCSFIVAAIFHMWSLIWGGVGDYTDSYKALVYSFTPAAILVWILPLSLIWSLILLGISVAKLHDMSKTRATWMVIVTVILLGAALYGAYWLWLTTGWFSSSTEA